MQPEKESDFFSSVVYFYYRKIMAVQRPIHESYSSVYSLGISTSLLDYIFSWFCAHSGPAIYRLVYL